MALDFPYRHATRVQRQNLVIKAGPAGLMFGNELRLEAAVAGVAAFIGHGFMLVVAQVRSQFGLPRTLHNGLGELL
jgi:hypothetical protein